MHTVHLDDLLGRERYAGARQEIRRRIIEHKRRRRVQVGDHMSVLFEDAATVWFQTQEMLWVEGITDLDAIRNELRVYGALLPGTDELSATLLLEMVEQARIRDELQRLRGLHRHVALAVDGVRVAGIFEHGRESDMKLSAVQYVRFPLSPTLRDRLCDGGPLAIVVDHPAYGHVAPVPEAVRDSLVGDLRDAEAGHAALRWVRDG